MFNYEIKELIQEVIEICVKDSEKSVQFKLNGRWYSITIIDNMAYNGVEVIFYDDLLDTTVCHFMSNSDIILLHDTLEKVVFTIDYFLQVVSEYVKKMSINEEGLEIDVYNDMAL